MKLKKLGFAALAATAVFGLAACNPEATPNTPDNPDTPDTPDTPDNPYEGLVTSGSYTYNTYSESLGDNWNPHTWEDSGDSAILGYLSIGFVDMSIKSTEDAEYQWVYEMAESITDVTKDNKADLTKYKSTLPDGKTADQVEEGYVFQIKLNKNAKWQDGTAINADSYVESMKRLLDPEMLNYRANLYINGESAIAGAYDYYYSKTKGLYVSVGTKYANNAAAIAAGETVYLDVHEFYGAKGYTDKDGNACPQWVSIADETTYGAYALKDEFDKTNPEHCDPYTDEAGYDYVELPAKYTDETSPDYLNPEAEDYKEKLAAALKETYDALTDDEKTAIENEYYADCESSYYDEFTAKDVYEYYLAPGRPYASYCEVGGDYASWLSIYQTNENYNPEMGYETVGLYKVDDYTINYVLKTAEDYNYFLTSMTDTWLVKTDLYDQLTKTEGGMKTTKYMSDLKTSMSYGPYMMTAYQASKQIIFERNPYWYGYQKTEDGYLYSLTQFEVDGQKQQQYITQKIVIDVYQKQTAKEKFMKGELDDWAPDATDIPNYTMSSQIYKVDETYTMRLFFNTDPNKLDAMNAAGTNINGQVLTNEKFRKAFSLAIDRADFVTATEGYKPATYLMNNLYYYDIFNDPNSSYRKSEQAMETIVNFYGYEYGADKDYKTLEEAYNAITGYNPTAAAALLKEACDELVAAGKYVAGQDIKFQIGWQKAAMDASANACVAKLEKYLNDAAKDSGFGKITLEGIGSLTDRYKAVANGTYAIGYGAWGGAAFYPFRNFQVYMDPDQYDIHEAGCWDPTTETLTLEVNGESVTKTWQQWSNCMIGTGDYASADFDTKLDITAQLEAKYLEKYYCIPLCSTTVVSLLSYKVKYFTEDYNVMYGFGGLRLMRYTYNDAEWATYVQEQGGNLSYE